jgi:hypothetical protein
MPTRQARISTSVDRELALWLKRRSQIEGRPLAAIVRDILARTYAEQEERFWAREGDERLRTFEPGSGIAHGDAAVQEAWRTELDRREAEVERGEVELIPGDEVFERLRRRFG